MSDYLPEEVVVEILKRLPIEDLVRSISVCKSWYSLITSPNFISLHSKLLAAARSNTDLLLLRDATDEDRYSDRRYSPDDERYSIHLHNNKHHTFPLYKSIDFPFKSYNSCFRLVGCSNGVVCLSDDLITITHVIILWNPSIRKSVTLPRPLVTFHSHGAFQQFIGFGFNSATNDYKVVRVVYLDGFIMIESGPPMVEVYESSVGSWTSVDPKGFSYYIKKTGSHVFLGGSVHWVGINTDFYEMIVSFDLRTDIFGLIKFPDSVVDQGFRGGFSVSGIGESLALLQNIFASNVETCNVWVMKQYGVIDSWTKLFTIDLTGDLLGVCGVLKNEEALVIVDQTENRYSRLRKKALVTYDSKSKQRNFIGAIRKTRSVYVDYFVESLALLGVKGESVEQKESNNTAI